MIFFSFFLVFFTAWNSIENNYQMFKAQYAFYSLRHSEDKILHFIKNK